MQSDKTSNAMLSDDELVMLNDSFPGGTFDSSRWSAKSVYGVSAIRALLDSFHLVGRRIANVWTTSHDYFNDENGLDANGHDEQADVQRCMEIDEPFVIEFENRETFEMDVVMSPTYRISMNKIPIRLLKSKYDNVDPGVMFAPVVGRTITAVDFRTIPESGQDDSVESVLFRLDDGCALELSGFYDFIDVTLRDRTGEPCTVSLSDLSDGLFNYLDLHYDPSSGFEAKDRLLWFGWKGARKTEGYAVCLTPVLSGSHVRRPEPARVDIRDATWLVMGLYLNRPEAVANMDSIELSEAEWRAVLDAGDALLSGGHLATGDSPIARLLLEATPSSWECVGIGSDGPDPWNTARLRKLERFRTCLSEVRRWSAMVLPADGCMRVEM